MAGIKVVLSGSLRVPPEGATFVGEVDPDEPVAVVIHVKRRTPDKFAPGSAEDLARLSKPMTRRALEAQRRRTHARAAARVTRVATANGLRVGAVDLAQRTVVVEGTARQMAEVFGAILRRYADGWHEFRARVGQLTVPAEIAPWTRAILGFDQRPLAGSADRLLPQAGDGTGSGLWPTEIAALYGIPLDRDTSSVCVGIIALGGGYLSSDLAAAMAAMGRPVPTVVDVTVDGDGNQFVDGFSLAEQEIALDLQVAANLLPKARIVVYFANNATDSLTRAVHRAVFDDINRPQVVSVSWGNAEKTWADTSRDAMQAVLADAIRLRVSVVFAAGDLLATSGVADGKLHVWFPASSPYALGCGGTAPTLGGAGASIAAEAVWKQGLTGTGGGISDVFPIPAYQSKLTLPVSLNDGAARRGVPDVACAAAGTPGYRIVLNGQAVVKDGTSAATPLWAALLAIANTEREDPIGFVNPTLYSNSELCRAITQGDNRVDGRGYEAGPGWNACTGLGVPKGADILAALAGIPVA
jgi:kumamolisin